MTTTLVVLAHPERRSFNGAWAQATADACAALGHRVLWSDLTALDFAPAETAAQYPLHDPATPFDPLKVQEAAGEDLPPDVAREVAKLRAADHVVFHFPLWWFAPPAVLKGWFDRVFAHGALHDVDHRFDRGRLRGKTALLCVTTGADAHESAFNGKEGEIGMLLWPTAYTLRYLGVTVLTPEVVHGVHGYFEGAERGALEDRLRGVLARQSAVIAGLADRPALAFNADTDFDADGRLKPGAPSHTPFIRHRPEWIDRTM